MARQLTLAATFALAACDDTLLLPESQSTSGSGDMIAEPTKTAGGRFGDVFIASGVKTGTEVGVRAAQIRTELVALAQSVQRNDAAVVNSINATSQNAARYHGLKGVIEARLQVGSTPGNPELIAQWNQAQSQLDLMAQDINTMTALSSAIATDAATANYLNDRINATLLLSGAVEEDHRQLEVMQDEARQVSVLISRLLNLLRTDIQRQTTYVANERSNLTALSSAIKVGQLYGPALTQPTNQPRLGPTPLAAGAANEPLVVIRFDQPNVPFQQALYTALSAALEQRPGARFQVVAVAPARGSAGDVQIAQSESRQHAQSVYSSMSEMGLPPDRIDISATTSPGVTANEVHVFLR